MVNPINGEKPLALSTERSGASSRNSRAELAEGSESPREREAAESVGASVDVDNARQLYEMETQRAQGAATQIATPEQARSVLQQILQQFSALPEQAMRSQGSGVSAQLAGVLQTAPA